MTRLIRTEWLKLVTTRAPVAVTAGVIGLTALVTPFAMADIKPGAATAAADAREILAVGPGLLTALVLLVVGAIAAAGEFQHKTIITTYLITPRRSQVLAAKLAAHAILGAAVAALGAAISFPIVLLMADADGIDVGSTGQLATRALAIVAAGAFASMCGVAAGSIIRNQSASILVLLVWTLIAERFLGGIVPAVLPFGALLSAVGLAGDDAPSTVASLAVLGAWAAGLSILARQRFIGRDIT